MNPDQGRLLVALPGLTDPNFTRTVVLILEHSDEGALGVVINRVSNLQVTDHLPQLESSLAEPPLVYIGGPVEREVAVVVAARPEGIELVENVYGDLDGPVRVFSGYAGWGPGQLEAEIEEGSWLVVEGSPADVLTSDPDDLWRSVVRRQAGRVAMMSTYPRDLSSN